MGHNKITVHITGATISFILMILLAVAMVHAIYLIKYLIDLYFTA